MNQYSCYKPSGIDWIGDIPSHWKLKKLKYNTYVKARVGWHGLNSEEFFFGENGAYCVTGTDFNLGTVDWKTCYKVPLERYEEDKFIQLWENDLLITKDGTIGKIAVVRGLTGEATLNSGVFVVRPTSEEYTTDFLYWVLKSSVFTGFVNFTSKGSTIIHLYQDVFINLQNALPPLSEQAAIASYLDEKTTQLDTLIDRKRRLIDLLREEKTALINEAVTKGIDPDVSMKDSGIEWLGEIPAHWEVKKLKFNVTKIGSGVTPSGGSSVYKTEGIPFLRSQNIHFDGLRLDDVAYITDEVDESMQNSRVQDGDVLLNITGASIGRCFFIPDNFGKGNVNQHVCIVRPARKEVSTIFLYLLLRSAIGQTQIDLLQTGANREGLNFEQLKNFNFPFPSVDEQAEIVTHLNAETAKIDYTTSRIEREIELMQEYRTALISEVVTGKVRVV